MEQLYFTNMTRHTDVLNSQANRGESRRNIGDGTKTEPRHKQRTHDAVAVTDETRHTYGVCVVLLIYHKKLMARNVKMLGNCLTFQCKT